MSKISRIIIALFCLFIVSTVIQCKEGDECCEPRNFEYKIDATFDYPFVTKIKPEDYTERVGSMMHLARMVTKNICNGPCKKDEVCVPVIDEAIAIVSEYDLIDTIIYGKTMVCTLIVKGRCVCVKRGEEANEPGCGPPFIEVRTWEEKITKLGTKFTKIDYEELRKIVTERAQGAAVGLCFGGCKKNRVCSPDITNRTYSYTKYILKGTKTMPDWEILKCSISATGACKCKRP